MFIDTLNLDELMDEYSRLKDDPANAASAATLKEQVITLLYSEQAYKELVAVAGAHIKGKQILGDARDCVQELFVRGYIDRYDKQKYPDMRFVPYLLSSLENVCMALTQREFTQVRHTDGSTDDPNRIKITERNQEEDRDAIAEFFIGMAVCVLRIKGNASEPDPYYRAFATGYYVLLCRTHLHHVCRINRNEAESLMDRELIRFTFVSPCKTLNEIEETPCKTYAEIGLSGDDELDIPFEKKVYAAYFKVSAPMISQKWKPFTAMVGIPPKPKKENKAASSSEDSGR